jgi:hypothetical protein
LRFDQIGEGGLHDRHVIIEQNRKTRRNAGHAFAARTIIAMMRSSSHFWKRRKRFPRAPEVAPFGRAQHVGGLVTSVGLRHLRYKPADMLSIRWILRFHPNSHATLLSKNHQSSACPTSMTVTWQRGHFALRDGIDLLERADVRHGSAP